jgi:hypothetical protein
MSIEAVRHIIATMFSAQNALRELAPEFKWAGMGNVLGDFGEFVCLNFYELSKAPSGSNGFDAVNREGLTVQIKTNHASRSIGFRGSADLLLVLHVESDGSFKEIYFGDFEKAKKIASYSSRDNKFTLTISKLKQLSNSET